jgi:hypothetical protein
MIFEHFFKSLGVDENASVEEKREAVLKKIHEIFPVRKEEKPAEAATEEPKEENN